MLTLLSAFVNLANLGVLGARYQAERVVSAWWKKASAHPKKAWETGKEEHRRWTFPPKKPTP